MLNLKIDLQPSRWFLGLLLLVVITSVVSISLLSWNVGLKLLLQVVTIGYGLQIAWQYGFLLSKNSVRQLCFDEAGWQIQDGSGLQFAELLGDSTVTRWVCVLRFKMAGQWRKRSCLIWRDSVDKEFYRQLVVAARWG